MAKLSGAELDAAYAKYQASQSQQSGPQQQQMPAMSGPALDAAYAQYLAQQGGKSTPQTIDAGPTTVQQAPGATQTYKNNRSNILGTIKDQAKSALFGAAQPFIDTAAYVQEQAQKPFNAISGAKPYDVNMNVAGRAPDQTTAQLAGIGSSFALPGGPLMKGAKSLMGQLGVGAGLGAAYGNVFGDPSKGVLANSAMGAALPVAMTGLGRALPAFVGNRLSGIQKQAEQPYSDVRSPEEANKILNSTSKLGIPVDIGSLTNEPFYKGLYGGGSKLPFAGQKGKMGVAVGKTNESANKIVNDITGGIEPSPEEIIPRIQRTHQDLSKKFEGRYNSLWKNAEGSNLKNIEVPNLNQIASKRLAEHADDISQNLPSSLEDNPSVMKLLNSLSKPIGRVKKTDQSMIVDRYGSPLQDATEEVMPNNGSLEDLKKIRTKIREVSDGIDKTKGSYGPLKSLLGDLYDAANNDIGHNIDKSGNQALKKEWQTLNADYKNTMVPFKDISPILRGEKGGSEAINAILKAPGIDPKTGKPMPHVVDQLDPQTKKLLYGHKVINSATGIDRADGKNSLSVNAARFIRGYQNLDTKQKRLLNSLLPPQDQNKIKELIDVNDATRGYRQIISPPLTGYQMKEYLSHAAPVAALGAEAIKGEKGGFLKTLGGLAAASAGNKGVMNLLSNPEILKAYTNPSKRAAILNDLLTPQAVRANPAGLAYMINQ